MSKYSLYESQQTADIFRITRIEFDFAAKVFPSWYSVVNKMRMCCHYHIHQHMEIIYMVYGQVEFQVNGISHRLSNNDVLIINPFEPHSAVIPQECDKVLYYAINIDLDSFKVIPIHDIKTVSKTLISRNGVYENRCTDNEIVRATTECIKGIIDNMTVHNELMQFSYLLRLFAILGEPICFDGEREHNRSGEFIRDVVLYIQSTPLQEISLESAAELFSYNKAYFTTLFKKNFTENFISKKEQLKLKRRLPE